MEFSPAPPSTVRDTSNSEASATPDQIAAQPSSSPTAGWKTWEIVALIGGGVTAAVLTVVVAVWGFDVVSTSFLVLAIALTLIVVFRKAGRSMSSLVGVLLGFALLRIALAFADNAPDKAAAESTFKAIGFSATFLALLTYLIAHVVQRESDSRMADRLSAGLALLAAVMYAFASLDGSKGALIGALTLGGGFVIVAVLFSRASSTRAARRVPRTTSGDEPR